MDFQRVPAAESILAVLILWAELALLFAARAHWLQ